MMMMRFFTKPTVTHLEWKSLQEIRPHQRDGIQGSDEADDLFGSLIVLTTQIQFTRREWDPVFFGGLIG